MEQGQCQSSRQNRILAAQRAWLLFCPKTGYRKGQDVSKYMVDSLRCITTRWLTQICHLARFMAIHLSNFFPTPQALQMHPDPPPPQKHRRAEIFRGQELYQILNTEYAWEILKRTVNWLAPECVNPEQSCVTTSLAH